MADVQADHPDLRCADLSGADLSWSQLQGTDLTHANLEWANLEKADLTGAQLRWANLSFAQVVGTNLRVADLRGADLSNVYPIAGDLTGRAVSLYQSVTPAMVTLGGFPADYLLPPPTDLIGAMYDSTTVFADGFDPEQAGMSLWEP